MENERAIIGGREYRLVKLLPSVEDGRKYVLCADGEGGQHVCPEELWPRHAPRPAQGGGVGANSSAQEKIALFLSLFRGREDVCARRYYSLKTGKSGYVPLCRNEWEPGLCDKKAHPCPECPNRDFVPLTAQIVKAHLVGQDGHGRDVAGIYPMLEDDQTRLLAADFDEEAWREDVSAFRETCAALGLTPAVERSRSGNGAHVWFFFSEPVPAAEARKLGSALLTRTMDRRHELRFQSYDRLFPSQDTVPKGGFGNLIALPFQGQAQKEGNTLFVDEDFVPYPDQWAYLASLPKITPEELAAHLGKLCAGGELGTLLEAEEPKPWPEKRKRKSLTRADFPAQARLMISDLLYVDKAGFSQKALNAVKRLAAFRNPEFYKKQTMRLRIYNTPRVFDCSWEDEAFLGVPRGCMDKLTELLASCGVPYALEDRREAGRPIAVSFRGELRPEQTPAAEALLAHDTGVLSATTAFGKTVVGAYLIGARKVSTLILVHSSALLEQWKEALERFLNIEEPLPEQPKKRGRKKSLERIGQIGAGKHTRSGIIDIAIMQSLFEGEDKEVRPFVAEYGMVLCDECHHVAAFTFEKILRAAKAKYVYGLSATPVRQDGHQPIIFMQCGPVRYLVDARSQADKRSFDHYVLPRFTRTRLPAVRKIQDAYAGIVQNDARNALLVSDAAELLREGRTPLILTERRDHAERLAGLLQGMAEHIFLLVGTGSQKEKREKLAALREAPPGESLVVIATGKYVGEGFDAPRLDTILLSMPISWKGTLAQYAGRLHRNYAGKQEVRIYDYVDLHVPVLERMYHKRLRGYAELGYQVKLAGHDPGSSRIYDGQDYLEPFARDVGEAAESVLIVSPFVKRSRLQKLRPALDGALASGVNITVRTRPDEGAVSLLESWGIAVETQEELWQRWAVIDKTVVWYGGVDYLSYSAKDATALRFESADVAGEVLDLQASAGLPEQLSMEG